MTDDMAGELARIIDGAAKTSSVMVLRGAGDDFCIGRHRAAPGVSAGAPPPPADALGPPRRQRRDLQLLRRLPPRRHPDHRRGARARARLRLRHRGAVRHHAGGRAGAIQGARICPQHHAHHGDVGAARRVPRKALNYLVYSTQAVGAERALACGLASEVVPEAELDATVDRLCQMILKAPRMATEAVKDYMRAAPDMAIAGAVDFARNLHATIIPRSRPG